MVAILICMFTAPVTSANETNCNLIDTSGIEIEQRDCLE